MSDYDAIVIGAGISGMGLSAFLARGGKRVLTLEKNKEIGGRAYSFTYKGHITNMGRSARWARGGQGRRHVRPARCGTRRARLLR